MSDLNPADLSPEEQEVLPRTEVTRLGDLFSWQSILFVVLCVGGLFLGLLYTFGIPLGDKHLIEGEYYWVFIGLFSAASFIAIPGKTGQMKIPTYDLIAAAVILGISLVFAFRAWDMVQGGWYNVPMGVIVMLMMLELSRRSGGIAFLAVVLVLGSYPLYADHVPGLLMGIPYSFDRMVEAHIFRNEGMMGITTKIVAEVILGFMVFAGVLLATGAGDFFINLANSVFGRYRGGPAKVSVVASAFFGSLSGSVFSNIAGTGAITIPTMKRVGYPPHYAGAIEACASTGGVVMPPVMGAIAFVMAITLGVDYRVVVIAAIIPSLLYYFGLLLQVDAYAAKNNLMGMDPKSLPKAGKTLRSGWPFLLVMIFLVWGLLYKRWEYYAPWYASLLMVILSFTNRETWMTPKRIWQTLREISVLVTQVSAIILPIAFVVSGMTITGVTGSITSGLVHLGGGNLYLVILFGILACFIMGMAGLSIVAYIFLAVTMAPAIVELGGLNEIAVHFFILYYAMLAAITPPVAAAAFLAATIAGAKPVLTSFIAMRLGVVIYIIPLFFLFEPSLVLQGNLLPLIYVLPSAIVGIMLIAGGFEGYLLGVGRIPGWLRLPLAAAGFVLSLPSLTMTFIGVVASVIGVALAWILNRKSRQTPAAA